MYTDVKLLTTDAKHPRIPVIFINPKNNKSVTVNVLPDTGTTVTTIDDRYARLMGLDIKSGLQSGSINQQKESSFYKHILRIKIGTLKPINTIVDIGTGTDYNFEVNLLGMVTMLDYYSFIFGNGYVRIYDSAPNVAKAIPVTTAVKPPVTKTAAYAYAYLGQQSWKRRI